jgi:xanthine/uracil permease
VVAASLLDLQGVGRARFITSVLVALAATTLVQVAIGHRLPLFEGPSTPYLAMLVVLVQTAPPTAALRAELATSLIIAGVVVGIVSWVAGTAFARLLSPYVVGSFLFLLGVTLLLRLAPQAVGHTPSHLFEPAALWALVAVLVVSLAVHRVGPPVLRPLIFLVGYVVGLFAYLLAGGRLAFTVFAGPSRLVVPQVGPVALPDPALVLLVVLTMLIPLVNVYASIEAVGAAMPERPRVDLRATTMLYGASQVLAGLIGSIGTVPRSESSVLVAASGSASRRPLVIAAAALLAVAVVGPAVALLAEFPVPVATGVLMVAVVFVSVIALRIYRRVRWTGRRAGATAAALALCLASTAVSAGWGFAGVFLTNPILSGTILAIAIDQLDRSPLSRGLTQRA